jgi:hypothetical protein
MTLDIYARSTGLADRNAANAVGDFLRPSRTAELIRRGLVDK